jgi:predicted nucleic acid-binding protein
MSEASEPEEADGPPPTPMDLVVDAVVALKWYVPEPYEAEAKRLLDPAYMLHVPELFFAELGNIIWKKARVLSPRELTVEEGREILGLLGEVPLTAHRVGSLLESAYELATGPGRSTVYDCCYLALAVALDCRLVTADRPFYEAQRGGPQGGRLVWVADPL